MRSGTTASYMIVPVLELLHRSKTARKTYPVQEEVFEVGGSGTVLATCRISLLSCSMASFLHVVPSPPEIHIS